MPKASDNIKIYRNPNGPVVSTVNRRVLEQDGLTFKDIDGTGTLSPVNDWRNSPTERAAAYVKTLSVKEKIAQLFHFGLADGQVPHHWPHGGPI